ncbi:MAG: transcriptional regulator, TetR family [Solirubrobacteraceae bacterium]|nr:transcriptional regulator, TetR family [Solirubrobacteraceae bacterium]
MRVSRPPTLSREAVLDETLALAEENGLGAVSMRAVAARLGVTPMALYRHVGDKQGLLDGLVERILAELPIPDAARPWAERLDTLGASLRATAARHPDAFVLLLRRPAVTPAALRVRDAVYSALRDAGVAEADVPRAERLLSTFMLGFAASEAGGRFAHHEPGVVAADLEWAQTLVLGLL